MGDPDGTITNWVINGSMPRAQRSIPDPFSDQLLPTSGQGKFIVTSESVHINTTDGTLLPVAFVMIQFTRYFRGTRRPADSNAIQSTPKCQ